MTIGQPLKVTNQIGSPISATHNTHNDWLFHSTTIDRYKVSNLLLAPAILTISANIRLPPPPYRQATALGRFPLSLENGSPWPPAPALMTPKQMKGEKEFGAAKAKYRPRFGPIKQ